MRLGIRWSCLSSLTARDGVIALGLALVFTGVSGLYTPFHACIVTGGVLLLMVLWGSFWTIRALERTRGRGRS